MHAERLDKQSTVTVWRSSDKRRSERESRRRTLQVTWRRDRQNKGTVSEQDKEHETIMEGACDRNQEERRNKRRQRRQRCRNSRRRWRGR
eukprot:768475-Hanusia_phi.AAC.2